MGYNLTENLFGYTLVQDILVESATTSVTFSGLNYTATDDLLLVSDFVNNSGASSDYNVYVNGINSNNSYYRQTQYSSSTTVGAGRYNDGMFAYCPNGGKTQNFARIKLTNSGYRVVQGEQCENYGGSSIVQAIACSTSTFTLSSITSITISGNTNSIGIGSRFRLYKLNATKVADITVGTATTSVDITGLNITKDSEYMLVSEFNNANASSVNCNLFANNNTTITNYYSQYLLADSTSISSSRLNSPIYFGADGTRRGLSVCNIKITNNGNFVFQSSEIRNFGSSVCALFNWNGTSTFTTNLITQLTISSNQTNAITNGSRFQLYRMKG